jgi:hypothetical protein
MENSYPIGTIDGIEILEKESSHFLRKVYLGRTKQG